MISCFEYKNYVSALIAGFEVSDIASCVILVRLVVMIVSIDLGLS